ncbi:helix-turn-helix transcriptional regulator [Aeromicrobium sp. UC242_57]|uniref:helix-turn-helix transcriptional regulator n=1 Tax=Aeromicrobium sp. UC242_57 TaxID=3374624 RepID=UPI0037BB1493
MAQFQWSWLYEAADMGQVIREARTAARLTQAELADRLGVSRRTIVRLESGDQGAAIETAIQALGECGVALAAIPRGSTVRVQR